jgi:hypothetical protein
MDAESINREYFGCKVTAFTTANSIKWYPAFPWRFTVEHKGVVREYSGMPNYVETSRKALKRGWYRAKWLADGSYEKRYKSRGKPLEK